jgi:DNA polymerase III subunit epsilon
VTRRRGQLLEASSRLLNWRQATFCVIDLETTGLDLRRDEIVSYGMVRIENARIQARSATYGRVRPKRRVTVGALQVHGLRNADLDHDPPIEDVVDSLIESLTGRVIVAHAAWIERSFLDRAFRSRHTRVNPDLIDTAALSRAVGMAPRGTGREPNMERLAEAFNLCVHTPHHALGDAFTTAEVFLALATWLERQYAVESKGPLTVAELARLSRE